MDTLVEDIPWLGYTRLSVRSGSEPAILLLLQHALTEARVQIQPLEQIVEEHPNTYDPAANGELEATVTQVIGILRTNKLDIKTNSARNPA